MPRGAAASCAALAKELVNLGSARGTAGARRRFEARWQLSFWSGCLYEALSGRYAPLTPSLDVVSES